MAKGLAQRTGRYAAKLNLTPAWADPAAIEAFYKNCPEGYEVNHVIPMQGTEMRGLHVLGNLQYITKGADGGKGNKLVSNNRRIVTEAVAREHPGPVGILIYGRYCVQFTA